MATDPEPIERWVRHDEYCPAVGAKGPCDCGLAEALAASPTVTTTVDCDDCGGPSMAETDTRAALTPLQREVEPPPTCQRCQQPISALSQMYRCASCHRLFDYGCVLQHFGWSVSGVPEIVGEAQHGD